MEALPDGIHSGLAHQGAKGVFFYFTAEEKRKHDTSQVSVPKGRRHFWRYIDLMEHPQGGRIEENRYILTNLIQCHPDTVRVVPPDGSVNIFALQEKVIASILQASVEQIAVAEAPKILDPIQQTVSTTIRGSIHNPLVSRKEVLIAIQRLGSPLPGVYLKALRKAYETFLFNKDINELLAAVNVLGDAPTSDAENGNGTTEQGPSKGRKALLKRDDLKLICFEYVWH